MSKDQKRYGHRQPEDRTEAEGRQLRWRSGVMVGLFAAALCVYCGVLYNIQVVHGADYQAIAAANTSMQTETVDAVRGDILDSHGRVLVTNESAYQVSLDSSLMGDARNEILTQLLALCREEGVEWTDTFPVTDSAPYSFTKPDVYTYLYTKKDDQGNTVSQEQRRTNLGALAVSYKWMDDPLDDEPKQDAVTYLDAETLMVKMCGTYGIELDEENAEITSEIRDLLGVLYELSLRSRQITYSEYVFAENVDITFITKVKEFGLDGVAFETETTRKYNTTYAAHVLGRTGKYTSDEMWEKYKALGYPYDAVVRLQGAELAFEEYLHGTSGNRKVLTSDSGKIVSQEWEEEPVPGGNVTLTLDIGMQKVAEDAIAAHAASLEKAGGAAVAGCCANMIGFAVMSFRENRWGGLVSQGLGTSMLQMGNIVRNPRIWLPAILTSAITGPLATCVFQFQMNDPSGGVASGMGTCGLVGPIGVYAGWVADVASGAKAAITAMDWAAMVLICFLLPGVLTWAFGLVLRRVGWIREGDLKLD